MYPHDANKDELARIEILSGLSTFDVRAYKDQMIGMPMKIGDDIAGRALDVWVDDKKNLRIFFQMDWLTPGYFTHLQIGYRIELQGERVLKVFGFDCCLSSVEGAMYEEATFRVVTWNVQKAKQRHFKRDFLY